MVSEGEWGMDEWESEGESEGECYIFIMFGGSVVEEEKGRLSQ